MTTKYEPQKLNTFFDIVKNVFPHPAMVKTILDVGSLHALEAIEFSKVFNNSKIYSFEANPQSFLNCVENTKDIKSIKVTNIAINNYTGKCKFYPINKEKTITPWFDGNQGASSLYKSNGAYDFIEKYVQDEIEVDCIRLDQWCAENTIQEIDILWMDLQGAELNALEGLGNLLKNVKIIHTELEMNPIYTNQCLFKDVNRYLIERGFKLVSGDTDTLFGSDFIYINTNV